MDIVKWETVPDSGGGELLRAQVPGGWLVRYVDAIDSPATDSHRNNSADYVSTMTFYPDPIHRWLSAPS